MKSRLFSKSVFLVGNFCVLGFLLLFLRMVSAARLTHMVLISLAATVAIAFFSTFLCSATPDHKTSSILLRLFSWGYGLLFVGLGFFSLIGIQEYGLPPLLYSSTVQAFETLSTHAKENIHRPISNERLLWGNTELTIKQLTNPSTYQLRTTKLLDYSVSFFNYKTLRFLFQEIFLRNTYHFTTDTKKPFIIDCGSNIGMSVLYFKSLYPAANIICFEPDPTTFQVLESNIKQNNLSNVQAVNKAVATSDQPITFYFENNAPGHLRMSTSEQRAGVGKQTQTVQATMLSSFINQPVDFLKMDVEGAETSVIQELAQKGKLSLVKQMIIEFHHHMSLTAQDELATMLKTLQDAGFTYQISADFALPFKAHKNQEFMIFAYQK